MTQLPSYMALLAAAGYNVCDRGVHDEIHFVVARPDGTITDAEYALVEHQLLQTAAADLMAEWRAINPSISRIWRAPCADLSLQPK